MIYWALYKYFYYYLLLLNEKSQKNYMSADDYICLLPVIGRAYVPITKNARMCTL